MSRKWWYFLVVHGRDGSKGNQPYSVDIETLRRPQQDEGSKELGQRPRTWELSGRSVLHRALLREVIHFPRTVTYQHKIKMIVKLKLTRVPLRLFEVGALLVRRVLRRFDRGVVGVS